MIKRRCSRSAPFSQIESLENRTLMSAGGAAHAAAKKSVTPTTAAVLQLSRHVTRLGENLTVNVKVGGGKGSTVPTGSVELLSGGKPITTLSGPLTLPLNAAGRATYTFVAGNLEFYYGIYNLKAEYLGDATHPSGKSKNQTLYVNTQQFRNAGKQGVQVAIVSKGKGGSAVVAGDTVQLAYTGMLAANGSIFDYGTAHGDGTIPYISFVVEANPEAVIPGFDQGTLGMKLRETRIILIPAALGYGSNGSPPSIPANAQLLFVVTLLKIN